MVYGTIIADERAKGGVELHADYWEVIGKSDEEIEMRFNQVTSIRRQPPILPLMFISEFRSQRAVGQSLSSLAFAASQHYHEDAVAHGASIPRVLLRERFLRGHSSDFGAMRGRGWFHVV